MDARRYWWPGAIYSGWVPTCAGERRWTGQRRSCCSAVLSPVKERLLFVDTPRAVVLPHLIMHSLLARGVFTLRSVCRYESKLNRLQYRSCMPPCSRIECNYDSDRRAAWRGVARNASVVQFDVSFGVNSIIPSQSVDISRAAMRAAFSRVIGAAAGVESGAQPMRLSRDTSYRLERGGGIERNRGFVRC